METCVSLKQKIATFSSHISFIIVWQNYGCCIINVSGTIQVAGYINISFDTV